MNCRQGRREWRMGTIDRRCDPESREKDSMRPSKSAVPGASAGVVVGHPPTGW